jgi:PAS domain S-box-containing protein
MASVSQETRPGSETGALYRTLVEQIPAITYVDTLHEGGATPLFVSPQVWSITGASPQEWLSEPRLWRRFLHPEDHDRAIEEFEAGLAAGGSFGLSYRLLRPDGRTVWIDERATVLTDERGRPSFLHGVLLDVSEWREAGERSRESASLLAATLEATADGILVVDLEGHIVAFNDRFRQMWRIPKEVLDTRDDDRAIEHVLEQLRAPDAFVSKVRELYTTPFADSLDVLEFRDGRVFERYSAPRLLAGEPAGRVWSFRDITDKVQIEAELRRAEERYRLLVERLPAVVYEAEFGFPAPWLYVSPYVTQMLGYEPREFIERSDLWWELIHPDDRARVQQEEERSRSTGQPLVSEYRMIARDGRVRWVRDEAQVVTDDEGAPILLRGLWLDITERRRPEATT